jgi:hypothetical protein
LPDTLAGGGSRRSTRREHVEQLDRMGAIEVFQQTIGQMDAVLAE